MKTSHFWQLMTDEFGDTHARMIADSLVLPGLHDTAAHALARGVEPREVWHAVCDLHDIPASRRLGRDIPTRTTRAMDI